MSEGFLHLLLKSGRDLTPVSKVGIIFLSHFKRVGTISLLLSRKDIDEYPPNSCTRI